MTDIDGWVAPGWEPVRAAFEANFERGEEVGAAFAAYHDGRLVADLWGGVADPTDDRPWQRDTLVPVYSTTKGATALCLNRLVDDGLVDLDAPVAELWPEFATAGKADIPIRWLPSHRAGLAWIDGVTLTPEEMFAWDPVVDALAAAPPVWEPGTQHGYHATTYGWLVGEVVRRATGRSVGTYLRDEIAGPLGLDLWIGLPETEEHRVARLVGGTLRGGDADPAVASTTGNQTVADVPRPALDPEGPLAKSLGAPRGAFDRPGIWNSRALHAAEMPAANGITDARSVARLYAAALGPLPDGGDGAPGTAAPIVSDERRRDMARAHTEGPDVVLYDLDLQFGLGFMVHGDLLALGQPGSFGHIGFGGSLGWADPAQGLTVGYVCNRLADGLVGDLRSIHLLGACHQALARCRAPRPRP